MGNQNEKRKDQLDRAIAAHAGWKSQLRGAIASGKSSVTAERAGADNACEFGRWLYGTDFTKADKESSPYRTVRQCHAEFHRCAAKVLDLALAGRKAEAENAMAMGSPFSQASSALTQAVVRWRDS